MFTGLIEETGSVLGIKSSGEGKILEIAASKVLEGTKKGDSISINGACQTVTELSAKSFSVFVSRVTLDITTLGSFTPGRSVNLERALTLSSRLGGHIVQGHVDIRGKVKNIKKDIKGVEIEISLTVVSTSGNDFKLYLIPETIENTVIKDWKAGTDVNIETDILARYVEQMLKYGKGKPDNDTENDANFMGKLMENGYV
ncbi:MAG: riboflavin synthase [Spirochaetae bacterium HGW-Spirochaetae-5]|nr:MAG: riboflavin synthase [Spirochaetae bacterium HGW-Spirochaetae-5]